MVVKCGKAGSYGCFLFYIIYIYISVCNDIYIYMEPFFGFDSLQYGGNHWVCLKVGQQKSHG